MYVFACILSPQVDKPRFGIIVSDYIGSHTKSYRHFRKTNTSSSARSCESHVIVYTSQHTNFDPGNILHSASRTKQSTTCENMRELPKPGRNFMTTNFSDNVFFNMIWWQFSYWYPFRHTTTKAFQNSVLHNVRVRLYCIRSLYQIRYFAKTIQYFLIFSHTEQFRYMKFAEFKFLWLKGNNRCDWVFTPLVRTHWNLSEDTILHFFWVI